MEQLPVSLHGVFWTTAGQQRRLEDAASDWYAAMSSNAGFLGGVVQRPNAESRAAPWGGATHAIETTSFWRTEQDRVAWVLTTPHDPVFASVTEQATDRISNRLELEHLVGSPAGATIVEHSVYSAATRPDWLQLRRDLLDAAASAAAAPGFCCFALLRPLAREHRTTFASRTQLLSFVGAGTAEDTMEMDTMSYWRTKAEWASWKAAATGPSQSTASKPVRHGLSAVLQSWGPRAAYYPRL